MRHRPGPNAGYLLKLQHCPHIIKVELRLEEIRRGEPLAVHNRSRGLLLADELLLALDPWRRLRGLLGRPAPAELGGLLLLPCRSVHTCFMRYPIDVAFLDPEGRVVGLHGALRPWSFTPYHAEACCALELRSGRLQRSGTVAGDELVFLRRFPRD